MGVGFDRCDTCKKDNDCCKLWHAVVDGHIKITSEDRENKCKGPCQCGIVAQRIDDKDEPKKVFDEKHFSSESLTPSDWDELVNRKNEKWRFVAACLKMKDGQPATHDIPHGGTALSESGPGTLKIVAPKDLIHDRESNLYVVVLTKPEPNA